MSADGLISADPEGWLAAPDGRLRVPGEDFVLDMLVRDRVIGSSDDFMFLPEYHEHLDGPMVVALIYELPECDLCSQLGSEAKTARYDCRMVADSRGTWAYMCPFCFVEQGPRRLGGGRGQYLMPESEVSASVWERLEVAEATWRSRLGGR